MTINEIARNLMNHLANADVVSEEQFISIIEGYLLQAKCCTDSCQSVVCEGREIMIFDDPESQT